MIIERSGFLLIAGALAAGGGAGWLVRDSGIGQQRETVLVATPVPTPVVVAKPEPTGVMVVDSEAVAPACDDSVGAAEDCPNIGPSDEGLCGNRIAKRCADFKESFKPRVAQEAVACLNRLKGKERCDTARLDLCGHSALMTACPEMQEPATGTYIHATTTTPASFTVEPSTKAPSALAIACKSMQQSCADHALGPNVKDCIQTLAGMNEQGRARTLSCVASHCEDLGLLGCEAAAVEPAAAAAKP